jgi:hypothetical protein
VIYYSNPKKKTKGLSESYPACVEFTVGEGKNHNSQLTRLQESNKGAKRIENNEKRASFLEAWKESD